MGEENARSATVQASVFQNRAKALWASRIPVRHTNDLQTVDGHRFVVHNADTRTLDGIEIPGGIGKLFVIPGYEIRAEWRGEVFPGCGESLRIHLSSVVEVARKEHHIRPQAPQHGDNAPYESGPIDMSEMNVGDQRPDPAPPGWRQTRQR